MSTLQGISAAVPILLLSIPVGRLTDRVNRVRLLIAVDLVAVAGAIATAFAGGFASLFIGRVLAAVGLVCGLPIAVSIMADLSARSSRGRALLLLLLGRSLGAAIAFALGGWLFGRLAAGGQIRSALPGLEPWRAVNLVFAIGALVPVGSLLALREPVRGEIGHSVEATFAPALKRLWAMRRFLLPLFAGHVSVLMADTAASIWASPVLTRSYGLRPDQFAGPMGLIVLFTGVLGAIVGGLAVDRGQRSGDPGRFLLGAVIAAAIGIPAGLFAAAPTAPLFFVLLFALLFCGGVAAIATTTAIAVFVPNELRGTCMGMLITLSGVVSFGLAPTLVSVIGKALGGPAHVGAALAITAVATGLLSLLGFATAMRRVPPVPTYCQSTEKA